MRQYCLHVSQLGGSCSDRDYTISRRHRSRPRSRATAPRSTSCTFKLTVNSEKNPTDVTAQLFTVAGVITSAAAGEVESERRPISGRYYYDVEMTDGTGAIRTAIKGPYRFVQDITKA